MNFDELVKGAFKHEEARIIQPVDKQNEILNNILAQSEKRKHSFVRRIREKLKFEFMPVSIMELAGVLLFAVILFTIPVLINYNNSRNVGNQITNVAQEPLIKLYFLNSNAEYLVEEERNIKDATPIKAIQALIDGPENKSLSRTLPKELEVTSVSLKDGVAYVHINESVPQEQHSNYGSSLATTNIIRSICSTLVFNNQFGISKVKLEGSICELLYGVDTNELFDAGISISRVIFDSAVRNSTLKSNSTNLQSISNQLMGRFFEEYKKDDVPKELKITDYKIDRLSDFEGDASKFSFSIEYSLKPAFTNSYVLAGNGEMKGEWIEKKYAYVDVMKINDEYRIVNMGTGR